MAEPERVYMSGFLRKRQRGKHKRRESQLKNLKFQERFCTLTEYSFTYSKKENSKARGSFQASRIKLVANTDPRAFKRGSLASPDVYFQIGDETEVLYLIASTKAARDKWKEAFLKVAGERGNKMLERYHFGAYGSKTIGQWSCCNKSRKDASGCQSVTTLTRNISQTSIKSDDTLKSDNSSLTSSITHSSSCSSGSSKYSSLMEPDCLSQTLIHRELVNFDDRVTNPVRRSRASTTESGISDMNQHSKAGAKRQQLPSVDSDITDIMLSDEFEETEDEGIGRNVRKYQEGTQAEGKKETMHVDQGVSTVAYDMLIPAFSLILPQTPNTLLLHQNLLIVGVNGMLQVWYTATANLTLKTSLKIAGQVVSLDSWNDFIAVGSSVVQLIQLKPGADPKRILYAKGKNRLQSPNSQYLVTFLGEDGHLASATVGGNTVDIWDPPSIDSYKIVTKPKSKITFDDHEIVSLTAPKEPNESWIVVITKENGHIKASVSDWKSSSPDRTFEIGEDYDLSNIYAHVHLNDLYLVGGYGRNISVMDTQTGNMCSKTLQDQTISCLSGSKGEILIGTTSGDVIAFSEDDLTQINRFTNNTASVVAVAVDEDFSSVYIAYNNGDLKVWSTSDGFNDIHDSVPGLTAVHDEEQAFDCVLGQQLCSEGILTQRQVFRLSTQESLSFPFKDNGASIELPSEILEYPDPLFEAAFSPFGPVGTHFILPEKMIPVSSAVWLCVSPYEKFRSPATLKISHCFSCNSSEDAKLLRFLKAEHKSIKRDEFGNLSITFEEVDPEQSKFLPKEQTGTLIDHHFCIYCLAAVSEQKEVLGKINYCLTILKPKHYPTKENMKIYCILHFDLKGCKKLVEEQTPKDYDTVTKYLQFTTRRLESALQIKLNKAEAEKCGWVITIESETEIFAEDVNFFNYLKVDYLEAACKTSDIHKPYPYAYPPRFVLEVSARYAKQYSFIELTFTGARRDLYTEIQLHPLRCEDDLNAINDTERDDAQRPTEVSQPRPFLNGNWDPAAETGIDED